MKIAKQTAKKILAILLIVFGGLILLGGTIFSIGMATAGWNFSAMNTVDYQHHTYTETQEITGLTLNFDTNDIKVYFDETATQVRVEYSEKYSKKGNQITKTYITEENGTLKIRQEHKFTLTTEFSIGESSYARIYLPKDRAYALNIETDTGDIWLNGTATLTNLNIETDTGAINLGNATIVCDGVIDLSTDTGNILLAAFTAKNLELETSTGDVALSGNGSVENKAEIETDTGDVYLGNLTGVTLNVETSTGDVESFHKRVLNFTTLTLETSTGDLEINLAGEAVEYFIRAHTNTGDTNLHNSYENQQSKRLTIRSSTGDIEVEFTPNITGK